MDYHFLSETSFYATCLDENRNVDVTFPRFKQSELFELIYIKKGRAALTVDLKNCNVGDSSLFCLFPGQINRFNTMHELVGYRIAFSQEFLCTGSALKYLPPSLDYAGRAGQFEVLTLTNDMQKEVETIVEMIVSEYNNRQRLWAQMLHGLLKVLIAYFPTNLDLAGFGRVIGADYLFFSRFMNLLEQKFTLQRQVSAYASDLAVSANYLSEVVKRVSGYSASHHIQQRLLLEAKRKAVSSDSSMKEIALGLGFDDPSTFSKFFKTMTGINFSDFRDSWVDVAE